MREGAGSFDEPAPSSRPRPSYLVCLSRQPSVGDGTPTGVLFHAQFVLSTLQNYTFCDIIPLFC